MPIHGLRLANVGPFDDAGFEFDEQVNVLVGPNNCGKSCMLTALAHVAAYPTAFDVGFLRSGKARFELRYGATLSGGRTLSGLLPIAEEVLMREGRVQPVADMLRELGFSSFVPAVRWSSGFRSKGPTANGEAAQAAHIRTMSPRQRHHAQHLMVVHRGHSRGFPELARRGGPVEGSASLVGDGAIVQAVIDLDYRSYRHKKSGMRLLIDSIGSLASEITQGFAIEFTGVAEDEDGLFPKFSTPDGELPLNCLSQGTQSIIQWLGHLLLGYAQYYDYPPKLEEHPAILIIDEIDAHLHPSWQRRIIPTLTRHFPKLQLFCSTHSPLMLAGLKAGQVQLLRRNEKTGKVEVSRNETDIVGWSADEILRSFLDVESPTDLQTVQDLERLHELRGKKRLTAKQKEELEQLRHKVGQNLLGGPIAGEMARLKELLAEAASRVTVTAAPKARKKTKKATRRSKTKRSSKTGARAK